MRPAVAIVGKPNVGKSTLFNRIVRKGISIVEKEPGVTRDRIYAEAEWSGTRFTLVDTGGIGTAVADEITSQVKRQAAIAIREAAVIIFLVDARGGVTVADQEIAGELRRAGKAVILAANKVDSEPEPGALAEFAALGYGEPLAISAAHGLNVGDLLDEVVRSLPAGLPDEQEGELAKVAVVGRPNVGKSSLVNALLGQERVIVAETPGTTRDSIDIEAQKDGAKFVFIDTAGMRRRTRMEKPLERYGVARSLKAIERADVVFLVLDACQGVVAQDRRIAGFAHRRGRGGIVVVNKWDLVTRRRGLARMYVEAVRRALSFLEYAPIAFTSAVTGQGVDRLLPLVRFVAGHHRINLRTGVLNQVVQDAVGLNPPPTKGKRALKIFYATQVGTRPPTVALFAANPELATSTYLRYLEGRLREAFGLEGTPLRLVLRERR